MATALFISYGSTLVMMVHHQHDPDQTARFTDLRLQKDWALSSFSKNTSAKPLGAEKVEPADANANAAIEKPTQNVTNNKDKERYDSERWEQEKQASLDYVKSIQSLDRTLNFFHIPKTAGTAIEFAAGQRRIPWGSCLFHHRPRRGICRYPAGGLWASKIGWWHVPAQFFPLQMINPYQGAELFGVIRNPYDRMVSEFYYICTLRVTPWRPDQCNRTRLGDQQYMNTWLQTKLKTASSLSTAAAAAANSYLADNGHFTPQHDFVFGPHQVRMLDHVLQMDDDSLQKTFQQLMEAYSLETVQLEKRNALSAAARVVVDDTRTTTTTTTAKKSANTTTSENEQLLQVKDLDPHTYGAIHELYSEDFEQLGYSRRQPNKNDETTS